MPPTDESHVSPARFELKRLQPDRLVPTLAEEVGNGLVQKPPRIPPKYFYDERGSQLFDQICQTPEYYLTRAEASLLTRHADDIIKLCRPDAIVEFGSGTAEKTELLIAAANAHNDWLHYMPLDVCREMLVESARRLIQRYSGLTVEAWHGDFMHGMSHFSNHCERSLYTFLGSSIGNFSNRQAREFLIDVRDIARLDDWLLIGVDLVKDEAILNAAYNDRHGYTAAFNLNVLNVLNRELGGDFDATAFDHQAFFDGAQSRIEMRLVSARDQQVSLEKLGLSVNFDRGDHITTEYSRKYTPQAIHELLRSAGFFPRASFGVESGEFLLVLASCC